MITRPTPKLTRRYPEMSFKMVILPPNFMEDWPEKIKNAVPDCEVKLFHRTEDAADDLENADVAYGTVPLKLFKRAKKLRWIAAPMAGLGGEWFSDELGNSDVVVTNIRGVYNDHLGTHIMAFVAGLRTSLGLIYSTAAK